jgi:hypothetical protein
MTCMYPSPHMTCKPSNGGAGGCEGASIDLDECISACKVGGGGGVPGNAGPECHAQEGAEGGRVGEHCRGDGVACHGAVMDTSHVRESPPPPRMLPGHGAVTDQSQNSHSACVLDVTDDALVSREEVQALLEDAAGKLRLEEEWARTQGGAHLRVNFESSSSSRASSWDRFIFGTWWPWPAIGKNI